MPTRIEGLARTPEDVAKELSTVFGDVEYLPNREPHPNLLTADKVDQRINEYQNLAGIKIVGYREGFEFNGAKFTGVNNIVSINGMGLAEGISFIVPTGIDTFVPSKFCRIHGVDRGYKFWYGFEEFVKPTTNETVTIYTFKFEGAKLSMYGTGSRINPDRQRDLARILGIKLED